MSESFSAVPSVLSVSTAPSMPRVPQPTETETVAETFAGVTALNRSRRAASCATRASRAAFSVNASYVMCVSVLSG